MNVDCIVAPLHLRYDAVRQRPHHVLARLGRRLPVLVVEEPLAAAVDASEFETYGGVTRLRPKRRDAGSAPVDDMTLEAIAQWVRGRSPLLWFYQPMMSAVADRFPAAPVVYDCMDELADFDFAPPDLGRRERALQERALAVFAGGRSLFERRNYLGDKISLFASGVDFEHFASAATLPRPQMLASLARPVCVYAGAIDERIDFAFIEALAARGASVVMAGPVVKIDAARLPRHPNVHFTGPVPYDDLPRLLAGADVAIMPFAHNAATRAISPTKTPEYLAARRPVVSTAVADVRAVFGDVVLFADDPGAFADACFAAARAHDPDKVALGERLARSQSWDDIVTRMWRTLEGETRPQ